MCTLNSRYIGAMLKGVLRNCVLRVLAAKAKGIVNNFTGPTLQLRQFGCAQKITLKCSCAQKITLKCSSAIPEQLIHRRFARDVHQ